MSPIRLAMPLLLPLALATCSGKNGDSCTARGLDDGSTVIRCEDGTQVTIPAPRAGTDGVDGEPGAAGADGTPGATGSPGAPGDDGTPGANGSPGANGTSCTVVDNGDGTKTITCEDGTQVTVQDGEPGTAGNDGKPGTAGGNVEVLSLHGDAVVRANRVASTGQVPVDAIITQAVADAAGVVVVDFSVASASGAPVLDVVGVRASIAKLVPVPFAAPVTGDQTSKWVAYVYRTDTVVGGGYPNPAGATAHQAYEESSGTLTALAAGSYRYVFATQLANVTVDGTPITYERNRLHRVSLVISGARGSTGAATAEFVPDGSTGALSRDIVRNGVCESCHGNTLVDHAGAPARVERCVTCHTASDVDAQSGQSLDMKVMIHKIHRGGELPSVAGPDGNPWLTADNGEYVLWGIGDTRRDFGKVGFPAGISRCEKCHDGSGADDDAWKQRPAAATCGACHDDVTFDDVTTPHAPGPLTDDNMCATCHPSDTGVAPVTVLHATDTASVGAPLFDPRNVPEFTFDVTMTPPANGAFYVGSEAPVVSIVILRDGVPLADHRIQSGSAQGCAYVDRDTVCGPDADGKFATTSLFVSGPRGHARPVLTSAARAQIMSTSSGPFDLSAVGAALTLEVDQGAAIISTDAWGTRVPGTITVSVASGTWPSGPSVATAPEIIAWLNANASFAARAVAWNEGGKVAVRSRSLGTVAGLRLQAGAVTTAVFGDDTTVKMPVGTTTVNQLTSTTDPKVTRLIDHIEYALDPVTDLAPGTYVINLEVAQLGRLSSTVYRTPSVRTVAFNVKTSVDELPIAANCDACHQANGASGARGLVLDYSRHHKVLDGDAVDQCHACHDRQPQYATDPTGSGGWTGARSLARRVHAVHAGAELQYPLRAVDSPAGDWVVGRDWELAYPLDLRACESCHPAGATSDAWFNSPGRLACMGCHDADVTMTHMKLNTDDPTPLDPWSGDESESCSTCH